MRNTQTRLLGVVALLFASSALAADPLGFNPTGGYHLHGQHGAILGFIPGDSPSNLGVPGKLCNGRLGAEFDGPTRVESFTITQLNISEHDQNNRMPIQSFDVYADGKTTPVGTIVLENEKTEQTAPIRDLLTGEPITITATWLNLVPTGKYPSGSNDGNSGLMSFGFNGTAYAGSSPANPNLNPSLVTRVQAVNNTGYGGDATSRCVVDGNLASRGSQDGEGIFWGFGAAGEQSLTLYYDADNPVDAIGIIGIALLGNTLDRIAPRWVDITANDGQYERIILDGNQIQYNRYTLEKAFVDVEWLKITFPTSGSSPDYVNDWWPNSDCGSTGHFGLVELQAFAPVVIPEPATLTLLTLAGLSMLRQRR